MPLRLVALLVCLPCLVMAVPLNGARTQSSSLIARDGLRGFEVPIQRHEMSKRADITGAVNLGDNNDLLYTVPLTLGNTVMAVHLDTGSSDLWVISDACETALCRGSNLPRYHSSSLNASGTEVTMNYGDSTTGTYASGPIGSDVATVAGIAMLHQQFAAINSTTNPVIQYGASGIFGIGFPTGSLIQNAVASENSKPDTSDDFLLATSTDGPLLSRMAMSGQLEQPMFAISLQRDTVEIAGNGRFSVGQLPAGVDESSLTWVPVRLYTQAEGGITPPAFAPHETYPFRWEIDIDGVYIDGKLLPQSTIPGNGVSTSTVSALIDTGNSLIRGPSDVVENILKSVSPTYTGTSLSQPLLPCITPHTLAFKIGGQMFPVDPANFITPYQTGSATTCIASEIVATDPPGVGALFSWSLGDPFIKSNLVAFYYGNLTHPSVDPPRIGLLSTVPANANADLVQAVESASADNGIFASTIQYAVTQTAQNAAVVTINPTQASPSSATPEITHTIVPNTSTHSQSGSATRSLRPGDVWLALFCPLILLSMHLLCI